MQGRTTIEQTGFNLDDDGFVILAANDAEPCVAYTGSFRSATMYVVGYETPYERVFHRGQATSASAWANEHGGLSIRKTRASALCAHIVTAVLDGTYPTAV